jgi:hypothetical protein
MLKGEGTVVKIKYLVSSSNENKPSILSASSPKKKIMTPRHEIELTRVAICADHTGQYGRCTNSQ